MVQSQSLFRTVLGNIKPVTEDGRTIHLARVQRHPRADGDKPKQYVPPRYNATMPDNAGHDATAGDSRYSLNVDEVATMYARAGHPRTFGAIYCLVPWLWKRRGLYSLRLVEWHFWVATL